MASRPWLPTFSMSTPKVVEPFGASSHSLSTEPSRFTTKVSESGVTWADAGAANASAGTAAAMASLVRVFINILQLCEVNVNERIGMLACDRNLHQIRKPMPPHACSNYIVGPCCIPRLPNIHPVGRRRARVKVLLTNKSSPRAVEFAPLESNFRCRMKSSEWGMTL